MIPTALLTTYAGDWHLPLLFPSLPYAHLSLSVPGKLACPWAAGREAPARAGGWEHREEVLFIPAPSLLGCGLAAPSPETP